jgi:hypothetical protein
MKRLAFCLVVLGICLAQTPGQAIPPPPAEYPACEDACCPAGSPTMQCTYNRVKMTCWNFYNHYFCP